MKTGYFALILFAGLAATGAAFAHSGAMGIVKERMDAMTEISRNVKTVGQMLKGTAAYNPGEIERAAKAISAHAGDAMTELFPEGSLDPPTEASPEIWAQWPEFSMFAGRLQSSARTLQDLAAQGAEQKNVAAAFGKVAATCKSCHEAFRIKK